MHICSVYRNYISRKYETEMVKPQFASFNQEIKRLQLKRFSQKKQDEGKTIPLQK